MDQVLAWASENANTISALASVSTLVVWIFYAHLLYRDYSSRHRPRLIIHQAPGGSANARCLLVNMSSGPLNVACVTAVAYVDGTAIKLQIDDYEHVASDVTDDQKERIATLSKQGPINSGDFLSLGTFGDLLQKFKSIGKQGSNKIEELEVRAVAFFGAQDEPIGATRRFLVEHNGTETQLKPTTLHTQQLHSWLQRRRVNTWLQECIALEHDEL